MKTAIILEPAEIEKIVHGEGLILTLSNGDRIEICADHDGKPLLATERSSPPPRDPPPPEKSLPPKRERRRGLRKARDSRAERSAAKKKVFFRILKETGDIKEAAKAAGVKTSLGYRWRVDQGQPSVVRTRRKRRAPHPRLRDFNRARTLSYWCHPCNRGFPSPNKLTEHQVKKHNMIVRTPAAAQVSTV